MHTQAAPTPRRRWHHSPEAHPMDASHTTAEHKQLDARALELVAARFRLLGDPMRLRLLQVLRQGECSVTNLARAVESTQPNISKHLRTLQEGGLVERRSRGNAAFYHICDPSVFTLCDVVCTGLQSRFEEQARLLAQAHAG